MAPNASSGPNVNGPRTSNNFAIPVEPKRHQKRKLDDLINLAEDGDPNNCRGDEWFRATADAKENAFDNFVDLTENGHLNNCRGDKRSRATADPRENVFDKAFDEEKPFVESEGFHASYDDRSRKKAKTNGAQNAQTGQDLVQRQLLFECGTCRKTFEMIADLNRHETEHKQRASVRCRKCRKNFTDIAERNRHYQTSARHFCCRYCTHVVEFGYAKSLCYHYIDHHGELYCHICDRHFLDSSQRLSHMEVRHRLCIACHKLFHMSGLHNDHCRDCYSAKYGKGFPNAATGDGPGGRLPNHYTRLGIGADSSHDGVLKAAKEMRIKTHPDRLKRQEGLTDEQERAIDREAALVGQAADVLSDPDLRQKYDRRMDGMAAMKWAL